MQSDSLLSKLSDVFLQHAKYFDQPWPADVEAANSVVKD